MPLLIDNHPERRVLASVTPLTQWTNDPGPPARGSRVYTVALGAHALVDGGRYELEEDDGTRFWVWFQAGANAGQATLYVFVP